MLALIVLSFRVRNRLQGRASTCLGLSPPARPAFALWRRASHALGARRRGLHRPASKRLGGSRHGRRRRTRIVVHASLSVIAKCDAAARSAPATRCRGFLIEVLNLAADFDILADEIVG